MHVMRSAVPVPLRNRTQKRRMVVGFWHWRPTGLPMGGSRGIFNAGLLLLQPDYYFLQQMLSQVTCKSHPCHVACLASLLLIFGGKSPWYQISVAWNYQLHQGAVLQWRAFLEDSSEADKAWLPQRLRMSLLESSI